MTVVTAETPDGRRAAFVVDDPPTAEDLRRLAGLAAMPRAPLRRMERRAGNGEPMSANQFAGERRFPFAALALAVAAGNLTTTELARRAGVGRRQMQRYAAAGVPERSADAIAVRLGLHPGEVWAEWFSEGAA